MKKKKEPYDVRIIISLLDGFFKNPKKTDKWLRIKNPLLGGLRPWDMIEAGREKKLERFIRDRLAENRPMMKRVEKQNRVEK